VAELPDGKENGLPVMVASRPAGLDGWGDSELPVGLRRGKEQSGRQRREDLQGETTALSACKTG